MLTKYSHLSDTELLRLRYNPADKSLVEELFDRLEAKIAEAPVTGGKTVKYKTDMTGVPV
jgi:hypothetical protein